MNTTTNPLGSNELRARIAAERARLLLEQNLLVDLEGQRLAPLEAGDDEALDRVEAQINACNERHSRIQDRLEILERRLTEATERELESELDAITARGNRARKYGEQLIDEYAELAPKLASILERLAAAERIVEESNCLLASAGRSERVESPNAIRCRPRSTWTEIETRKVDPHTPGHPCYGKDWVRPGSAPYVCLGNETFPISMESKVEVEHTDHGDRPEPLHLACELPGVGPELDRGKSLTPLWAASDRRVGYGGSEPREDVMAEVRERVDRESDAAPPAPAVAVVGKRGTGRAAVKRAGEQDDA